MKARKEDAWTAVGWTIALFLPITLYRAWIFSFLWAWFVLPLTGVAVPSVWLLAGALLVVSYTQGMRRDTDKTEYPWTEVVANLISGGVVYPSVGFVFAWVVAALGGLL